MQEILEYFPNLTDHQKSQFGQLYDLYIFWNQRINVVSRKDIEQLYTRHVLHSLAIAKYIQFRPGAKIMDVGTGGGFPGIPLAIMFPKANFVLIDSIQKKIKVVNNVIEETQLDNCTGLATRAEKVNQKFDFVVSRAVAQLPKFYAWVRNSFLSQNNHGLPNGIVYLKGGDLEEELAPFQERIKVTNISNYFKDEFFETKKIIHLFK